MTEKRFTVKKSGNGLFYSDGDYSIDNTIQFVIETVEFKLNQLNDENEQLKEKNKELDGKYVDEFSLRETLQQELRRVENENEELKKQIEELKVDFKMTKIDGAINRMAQRPIRW